MRAASEPPLRIVIADDHPIFLIGLRAVLERDTHISIVGEANSPQALSALLQHCACDVVVTLIGGSSVAGFALSCASDGMARRVRRAVAAVPASRVARCEKGRLNSGRRGEANM